MQNHTISIIVPVYNVEKYLKRCVDSILSQTYDNLEVILVDDGSTDTSGIICDDYATKDVRVKVIHKSNGGLSDARNVGIEESSGDYIGFVDSDDYIEVNAYKILMDSLINNAADMVVCGYEYVDEEGAPIGRPCPVGNCDKLSPIQYLGKISASGSGFYITAWNKLYKKEIFNNIRFPEGKVHEDNFVIHQIVDACNSITTIEDKLFFYTQRQTSISSGSAVYKQFDNVEALCNRVEYYSEREYDELIIGAMNQLIDVHLGIRRRYIFRSKKNHDTRNKAKWIKNNVKDVILKNTNNKILISKSCNPDYWICKQVIKERLKR